MKNHLTQSWKPLPSWLRFFIIASLVVGILFRFVNIEKKNFWFDEVFSSLRTAGYAEAEIVTNLSKPSLLRVEDFQYYQQVNPEKTPIDIINSLASEDPHHPPLYYFICRVWRNLFGSSVVVIRSLSVLVSLLIFPAIYWLCLELFDSPLVGVVTGVLVAVSPFHVLYAQEARQYSLWAVLVLVSSAALLRAIRLQKKSAWAIYAISLTACFYTFIFSVMVAMGQTIYVAIIERFRLTKTSIAYLIAGSLSVIAFSPWLWVLLQNRSQLNKVTAWTTVDRPLVQLFRSWIGNHGRLFFNTNVDDIDRFIHFFLIFLVGYAIYFICRDTPTRVYLLVLTLIGSTALSLSLPDLILGGGRSTLPRYLTPSYLGIELAVAYLFTTKLTRISVKGLQLRLWQFGIIALILGGILSCAINSTAVVGDNKRLNRDNFGVAAIVNQTNRPLLISDIDVPHLISLSYLIDPKVRFMIEANCSTCTVNSPSMKRQLVSNIRQGFSDVFLLLGPTSDKKLIQQVKTIPTDQKTLLYQDFGSQLWKITPTLISIQSDKTVSYCASNMHNTI